MFNSQIQEYRYTVDKQTFAPGVTFITICVCNLGLIDIDMDQLDILSAALPPLSSFQLLVWELLLVSVEFFSVLSSLLEEEVNREVLSKLGTLNTFYAGQGFAENLKLTRDIVERAEEDVNVFIPDTGAFIEMEVSVIDLINKIQDQILTEGYC